MCASERLVISEGTAVEVLAYLVTAARTQLDEAAEYAPMRLLTAARRLADGLDARASAPLRELVAAIDAMPVVATPSADRDAYVARVDELCVALADCLLALEGDIGEGA
ncbi:DUF6092 family protein [Conexibacter sp. CPCC 206217]|uniref:DUF6092 family protein n=1 Tax=Conexibacter sp. CPCC 206217 TaxID=3064574 RepID=UPI00271E0368|nr:DUF6092 family protein [Conexibacter sp. CPCC 206217]MDO8209576.1 DUF6092 family protein [Conexibacter sp. CPCC 206217]